MSPKLNLCTYSYRVSLEGTVEITIFKNAGNKLMIMKGESRREEEIGRLGLTYTRYYYKIDE